jgi:uncharacterized protein (TIGR04255 family)
MLLLVRLDIMTEYKPYPTLKKAPIEEAIISLTVKPKEKPSLEVLEKQVCSAFREEDSSLSKQESWFHSNVALHLHDTGLNTSHDKNQIGFILRTENLQKIIHVSPETLTLNLLKPYDSWTAFSASYEALWDTFAKVVMPKSITGLTIRYINDFFIPVQGWDEELLMRPSLEAGNERDQSSIAMGEAFTRCVLVSGVHMAQAVVMLNLMPQEEEQLRVVMDIEVQSSREPIEDYGSYHDIMGVMDRLRNFKNQIFFSNLPNAEVLFS